MGKASLEAEIQDPALAWKMFISCSQQKAKSVAEVGEFNKGGIEHMFIPFFLYLIL